MTRSDQWMDFQYGLSAVFGLVVGFLLCVLVFSCGSKIDQQRQAALEDNCTLLRVDKP